MHIGSFLITPTTFDRSQHGSRSHECKPWRQINLREWLLLCSWFSLRNRQEKVWRLLHQRKEIGDRKGLHSVHLWWKVKAFYWGHHEPCASHFPSEVSRTLAWAIKGLLLIVRAHVVKGQSILLRAWTLRPDNACGTCPPSKWGSRANCQRWGALVSIDHFQGFCKDYWHPWNTNPGWFPPRQEWWPRGP